MTDLHLDADLLEQLEKLAAGRAMDVNEFLAEAVRNYLRQIEQETMRHNITVFLARQQELKETYPGEFIAIHQGDLLDHDINYQALHSRIRQIYGRQPVLIRQVNTDPDRTWNFRSPRFDQPRP